MTWCKPAILHLFINKMQIFSEVCWLRSRAGRPLRWFPLAHTTVAATAARPPPPLSVPHNLVKIPCIELNIWIPWGFVKTIWISSILFLGTWSNTATLNLRQHRNTKSKLSHDSRFYGLQLLSDFLFTKAHQQSHYSTVLTIWSISNIQLNVCIYLIL